MMSTVLSLLSAESIKHYCASGFWRNKTIYALVQKLALRSPDSFAVRDRYQRVTYSQLISAADRLAADLARQGVRAGQRRTVRAKGEICGDNRCRQRQLTIYRAARD
jgi:non-ribosomal peptide synthetase component E (peptide arylation enzyme)